MKRKRGKKVFFFYYLSLKSIANEETAFSITNLVSTACSVCFEETVSTVSLQQKVYFENAQVFFLLLFVYSFNRKCNIRFFPFTFQEYIVCFPLSRGRFLLM